MKLVFGMACDGPAHPELPGGEAGVFGWEVVGPSGLIDTIEMQLGLTAPRQSQASRIARFVSKMREALDAQPTLFFAASARVDPWISARTLLAWRDELVRAGWDERAVGCERVDALASVAATGDRLPAGLEDRLATVRRALAAAPSLDIASIELVDYREALPPGWRELVGALADCGVEVVDRPAASPCAVGDLAHVQRFLESGATEPLDGDGSIAFVQSDTAVAAAEAVAEWLAHGSEQELHDTVVVCADGDTALLDLALQARGLPALGQSASSPWRGALQVLPLAIAAAWAPFDAKALLNLLLLPRPPVPRPVARRLANALSREPGMGGTEWRRAWDGIEADLSDQVARGELDRATADRRLAGWREWTAGGHHDRSDGMPARAASEIAERIQRWALMLDAGSEDELLLATAGAAGAFMEAVELIGLETVPALLIERILDQVTAEGARNPGHVPAAGGLRCVRHPGAIWANASRILWWGFKGPGERVPSSPWSSTELAALATAGCRLESTAERARRIGRSFAGPLLRARERMMLVSPAFDGGEQTTSHPLEHQMHPMIARFRPLITWRAERLLQEADHRLLGRDLRRELIGVVEPPLQRTVWTIPEGVRRRLTERVESATSLERLADCQMRWLLIDVLRLSRGRIAEIPDANQLLGNLAHELASQVLRTGEPPDPDRVLAEAEASFESMVRAIATPLERPEHAAELAAARTRVPRALAKLAGMLRDRGLAVVGTEVVRNRSFPDGPAVTGRLDLVVRHPVRGLGVIDLKWTRSAGRRRDELAEGRALQLATYAELADRDGATRADGAFFLLAQRRMIGPADGFLTDETISSDRTLAGTWTALVDTWRVWRDLTLAGTLVASGTADAADHVPADLPITPGAEPCRFCELTGLCRVFQEAM